jgi:hypothetical protein
MQPICTKCAEHTVGIPTPFYNPYLYNTSPYMTEGVMRERESSFIYRGNKLLI